MSTWVLMDVLDASMSQQAMQQQPPAPLYTWSVSFVKFSFMHVQAIQLMQCRSEHTLPVTCIHIGAGQVNALAITSSLDRSCKIWGLAQGEFYNFSLG